MAHLELTQAEVNAAIQELTSQNAEFKASVAKLASAQEELGAMWQGDANNAFKAAFNSDKEQWNNFANLLTSYIEGLSRIMTLYSNAEGKNVDTATRRTY